METRNSRLSALHLGAMIVCFAVVALDGFDTQSVAFVAPALHQSWDVSPELFGPLFGAGLLGTLIGSIALGSLADRFGRKRMLMLSVLVFGVMTIACAFADSIGQLGAYRFLAGLGLGGAIPNVLALISEYSPKSMRSTAIVITFAGFPIGAVIGGIASAQLIPAFGWPSVFLAGGALPILILPAIAAFVPESTGVREATVPVRELFRERRAAWTLLLWGLTFTTLLLAYFLVNWTPLLLVEAGLAHRQAIMGVVVLNLGGIIGSVLIGRISDRRGPFKALAAAFFVGAICVAAVGLLIQSTAATLLAFIFVVGFCVFGAQLNISAVSAIYYPVSMRSTGIGWNMGVGRIGSVVGPTVGGALIALGLGRGEMFLSAAIPAAIAGLIVVAMSFKAPDRDDP
ncbi:MAG: aromatic acid/H+ symport family MFS transporter [Woeseiaceae bacterium]